MLSIDVKSNVAAEASATIHASATVPSFKFSLESSPPLPTDAAATASLASAVLSVTKNPNDNSPRLQQTSLAVSSTATTTATGTTANAQGSLSSNSLNTPFTLRRKWYINPQFALMVGVVEIVVLIYVLRTLNMMESNFFQFGPPIQLFQYTITTTKEYCIILFIFFIHQIVFTWLNEVVGPWILNEVQDTNVRTITFSKPRTIVMINMYYVYFTLNNVIVVNVSFSQLAFLLAILLADLIATTTLNLHYIWNKKCVVFSDNIGTAELGIAGYSELSNEGDMELQPFATYKN